MAEGMIGGILGDEDEKEELEASGPLAGAEAFASAVAARLSAADPDVARKTAAFLEDQSRLLRTQNRHLEEEHALRLSHLQGQSREAKLRRAGMRFRISFQLFTALIASAIGIGLIVMIHDAITSRSVVIDAVDIAPNAAAQVPSGKIVAAGLLDVLTKIQASNRSSAEHRALSNAWTNEIAIEVPETGVSIGQIERTLKARLGHDLHIDGDLVQTEKGGLTLTVRGNGILPKSFTDEGRDLEKLLTLAGEYLYSQSQPGLWMAYLADTRADEAIRFAQSAYGTLEAGERPYVLNAWANALTSKGGEGVLAQALPLYREAVRLKPDYWSGYNNIMYALAGTGDEEGVVRVGEQMMKLAGGRPGKASENLYQNYDQVVWDLAAVRASTVADMESHNGVGTSGSAQGAENLSVAQFEAQLHDGEAAALRLRTTPVDEKNMADIGEAAFVRALLAEEDGDLKAAAKAWDAYSLAYADPTVASNNPPYVCYAAVTYEKTGQSAKADTALKPLGNGTYLDCDRFKGDVLDLRGDWAGAQQWYAKAVKLAPSAPSGFYSWGLALVKHGDLTGAMEKLQAANQKGPHWADPLKTWGDVLAKQGKSNDALRKYDEALKHAPHWKQLNEARAAIAKQKT
jgi:tetratricopeptide (TPR) repeat protein